MPTRVRLASDTGTSNASFGSLMARRKSSSNPVYQVRKASGLRGIDFATSVGISIHTLRSIEGQRLFCPAPVAQRIEAVFGAQRLSLRTKQGVPLDLNGKIYSAQSSKDWSSAHPPMDDHGFEGAFQSEVEHLHEIFAAARNKRGLPAMFGALKEFRDSVIGSFGLKGRVRAQSQETLVVTATDAADPV